MHLGLAGVLRRSCPLFLLTTTLLTGCGTAAFDVVGSSSPAAVGAIQGGVHGGQPPISNSHVYLYESVKTGYGVAAHSLLTTGTGTTFDGTNYYVTTDAAGSFSLSGRYTCTVGAEVYVLALGGNAGAGENSAIGLMAPLGECPANGSLLAVTPYVWVSEVTTVATAYALGGFMSSPTQFSSSASANALSGISNAMANALNIIDIATGSARTTTKASVVSAGTVPQSRINMLANILASCVNSTALQTSTCPTLAGLATSDGTPNGTPASNTAEMMVNIAHHPQSNIASLYALIPTQAAFQPTLTPQPKDFSLPIVYSYYSSQTTPIVNIAIDANGSLFSGYGAYIVKQMANGVIPTPYIDVSVGNVAYVAASPTGTIWAVHDVATKFSVVDTSLVKQGGPYSALANAAGYSPQAVAFNAAGQGSISSFTLTLNKFSATSLGTAIAYTTLGGGFATRLAVSGTGDVWAPPGNGGTRVLHVPAAGTSSESFATPESSNVSVAIDGADKIWMGTQDGAVVKYSFTAGTPNTLDTVGSYSTTGTANYSSIAIDGGGNVWAANQSAANVGAFTNAGGVIFAGGLANSTTYPSQAVAVDNGGNVWISTVGTNGSLKFSGPMVELLGAAVPVTTPLAPAPLSNGVVVPRLGTRP